MQGLYPFAGNDNCEYVATESTETRSTKLMMQCQENLVARRMKGSFELFGWRCATQYLERSSTDTDVLVKVRCTAAYSSSTGTVS
jgi:hypothetical protein